MISSKTKFPSGFQIGLGLILAGGIFWFYWPILVGLAVTLTNNEDYSFGLLLPLVAAYIIYLKWPQIRVGPWQPSWMGLAIMAAGFGLNIFGELITDIYTPEISFVAVITGLLWLLFGWGLVRLLAFPLLLLVFMIPLPDFVIRQLTLPLQLFSSRLAAGILRGGGIPLSLQGNVIDLGVRQVQVVAACSGLRYILSLSALGIIYCYFYQRRLWKAAVLLISVIPAAMIANALRVAGMAVFPALLEGFWHTFSGWLIFIFCFAFLTLLNWGLNFLSPPSSLPVPGDSSAKTELTFARKPSLTPYLMAALALVVLFGPIRLFIQASPMPLLQSFDNFPMNLGPWQGHRVYIDPAMVAATHADSFVNAEYLNPELGSVFLWMTYYESQKKAGSSAHSPFSCFRGSGWIALESETVELAPGLPVRYMLLDQSGTQIVVYYWFLQRGRWLVNEYLNKFYVGFDALFRRRADGALIRLTTNARPNVKSSRQRLTAFATLLVPVLPQYIQD